MDINLETNTFISNIHTRISNIKQNLEQNKNQIDKTIKQNTLDRGNYQSNMLNAENTERILNKNCLSSELKSQLFNAIEEYDKVCEETRKQLNELKIKSNNNQLSFGLEGLARNLYNEQRVIDAEKRYKENKKQEKMGQPPQQYTPPELTPAQEFALSAPRTRKNSSIGGKKTKKNIKKKCKRKRR